MGVRFFKHGDSLAIVLPEGLRKRANLKEDEEYEFLLLEPGVFALVSRPALEQRVRSQLVAELSQRLTATAGGQVNRPLAAPLAPPAARRPIAGPVTPENARELLDAQGFLILDNEGMVKMLSKPLEKDVKEGRVVGVRGFDKRYYIVTSDYYSKLSQVLAQALAKGERPAGEIARLAGCEEGACVAVLQVMKDFGEVIEKKKGVYALIT